VAIKKGVSLDFIRNCLARGILTPPAKDITGQYLWTEQDIERLVELSRKMRRSKVPAASAEPQTAA
jgi:hypothetical protein